MPEASKVLAFLNKLRKEGNKYNSYLEDFKDDLYEQIEAKIKNKYKSQELLALLG